MMNSSPVALYLLHCLGCGGCSIPGKPGARKRKLLPSVAGGASMDVIPASLLVKPAFQAPKVRKP
jgi:hypothetical protein